MSAVRPLGLRLKRYQRHSGLCRLKFMRTTSIDVPSENVLDIG
jgi:hypothetical protein